MLPVIASSASIARIVCPLFVKRCMPKPGLIVTGRIVPIQSASWWMCSTGTSVTSAAHSGG